MEMISLLLPSRKRPLEFKRMAESVIATLKRPVEIVARFDDDDLESAELAHKDGALVIVGPRLREMTIYWNECFDACSGEIVGQLNDDVIFRTPGWDEQIQEAFDSCADKILMVHGDHLGGYDGRQFGPHPFVHRRWVEALGYFIPPYFSSDHGDTWVNDLANALGRRRFLPFVIEHMHFSVGKMQVDETTLDRLKRHEEDHPEAIYEAKLDERVADANKLGALMNPKRQVTKARFYAHRSAGMCPKCEEGSTVFVGNLVACNHCGHTWRQI